MKPLLLNMAGLLLLFCSALSVAQTPDIQKIITEKDSLFWIAFNNCDEQRMHEFVADDIEFYHDKGGIQKGWNTFAETTRKNLCGRRDKWKMRREATPGTYKIFAMENDGKIYGAILYGEHRFFVTEDGKPEYWSGVAKFTHLWLLQDGNWKMSRILSYDHAAAPSRHHAVAIPEKNLKKFEGKYQSSQGLIAVTALKKSLLLDIGGKKYEVQPESENSFFWGERDLAFEFVKSGTVVEKIVIRENGNFVENAVRQK